MDLKSPSLASFHWNSARNKAHLSFLLLLCFIFLSTSVQALHLIGIKNQSPLIAQLPQIRYSDPFQASNQKSTFRSEAVVSNYISNGTDDNIRYQIDGETLALTHSFSWQLNDGHHLGLSLPWYHHSGGILDSPIYEFHDTFGMPQNGRSKNANNNLQWQIRNNNENIYSLSRNSNALGDVTIYSEQAIETFLDSVIDTHNMEFFNDGAKLLSSITLPTGDLSDRASGDSYGASLSLSNPILHPHNGKWFNPLSYWWGFGASIQKISSQFDGLRPNEVVLGAQFGASYTFSNSISLRSWLDTHTPYFDTEIRELGWVPVIYNLALNHATPSHSIHIGFSEDLRPNTSPDFVIFTSLDINL